MIEKIIYDYLNNMLNIPAYLEKPATVPNEYVLIEKTGSNQNLTLKEATFAIQSCAKSLFEAATLNEEVKDVMNMIADKVDKVVFCKLNSDYNFTDTTAKEYRYQAVFDVTHY